MVAVCGPIITARREGGTNRRARRSGRGAAATFAGPSLVAIVLGCSSCCWTPKIVLDLCIWARRRIWAQATRALRLVGIIRSIRLVPGVERSYVIPEELPLIGRKHGDPLRAFEMLARCLDAYLCYLRLAHSSLVLSSRGSVELSRTYLDLSSSLVPC